MPDHANDGGLAELLAEVRRIEVLSKRLVTGTLAGGYGSAFRGVGIEFEEVREYVDGDDPRSVDWNVTARSPSVAGLPYVKKYVEERELTVLFLLDLSASMDGGFGVWSARQTAARVCACLALSAVGSGDKTGLVAFSDRIEERVPARKGAAHALRIVRDCLALPSRGERTDMTAALEFAARGVRRRAVVFIVSDFLCDMPRAALSACARRHDVVAARISAAAPPPDAGLCRVRDPESGREFVADWADARTRETHDRRVAARRARTEDELRRADVDLLDVPVPLVPDRNSIAGPIVRFFRMRERRGAKR